MLELQVWCLSFYFRLCFQRLGFEALQICFHPARVHPTNKWEQFVPTLFANPTHDNFRHFSILIQLKPHGAPFVKFISFHGIQEPAVRKSQKASKRKGFIRRTSFIFQAIGIQMFSSRRMSTKRGHNRLRKPYFEHFWARAQNLAKIGLKSLILSICGLRPQTWAE